MLKSFKTTIFACYIGYIVQAIIVNFLPLLYVQLTGQFNISIEKITLLITVTFSLQLLIDLLASKFVDRIGYRPCVVVAHIFAFIGLASLGILPFVFEDAYIGLFFSVLCYSTGAGLIEVLISPIIEACPTENKSGSMQLLHSFYCWGMLLTVLASTGLFMLFGIDNWRYAAIIWSIVPFVNCFLFMVCPINSVSAEGHTSSIKGLLKNKVVWLIFILMLCSGAAEVGVSQWISTFVEQGLKISKTYSDLLGPCIFALVMAICRMLYGFFSEKINLRKALIISSALCIVAYFIIIISPWAWLSLVGAALCGVSVAIMWPGILSFGSAKVSDGGTTLFAFMALWGDAGCVIGPGLIGFVGGSTSIGASLGFGIIFPIVMFLVLLFFNTKKRDNA